MAPDRVALTAVHGGLGSHQYEDEPSRYESESIDIHASVGVECRCRSIGRATTKADQKPIEEVKAKAEAGDAESEMELGGSLRQGEGVVKDQAEAAMVSQSREQVTPRLNTTSVLLPREGVVKDQVEAEKWIRKAAEQIWPKLDTPWASATNGATAAATPWRRMTWRRQVVSQSRRTESRRGSSNLGVCYDRGDGVAEDHAEAAKWYRKAAEQNDADAQYNLAICYERGDGVAEDWIEAYSGCCWQRGKAMRLLGTHDLAGK